MNETEIIFGLKNSDPKAFSALFKMYYPRLKFFAQELTGDTSESEDIVMRIFQLFWNSRERFDTLVNIKAFFYLNVRNRSFDYLKSRRRAGEVYEEYNVRVLNAPEEKDAERRLMEAQLLSVVHGKLHKLPKRCAEIFRLTYFEGMKAGEIAKHLNISTSTVTTQRSLAIKYLKQILTEEEFMIVLILISSLLK
jgi:RNA polymerase sigma-70 factor (family 1)